MPKLIIKELAKKQKINRHQLHIRSGITYSVVRRYWDNDTESWDVETLSQIAKVLGVEVKDLIENGDHSEKAESTNSAEA